MTYLKRLAWALLVLISAGAVQAQDLPQTIIVMDGSGSMWGQIEGRAKLEIARETVAEVLQTIPAEQALGLLAYGHRTKGDCGDIELIVPPAAGTADQIIDTVNAMRFLGKTPLSDAVLQAAEALRYTESAATVVLVTDGLETCEADPCALGVALEAAGLDFTTHVIGFGLTAEEGAQVACLAENTGGRYFEASDSAALSGALSAAVAAAPVEEPVEAPLPEASIMAPAQAAKGTVISIEWQGPDGHLDVIEIAQPGGAAGRHYTYTADGNPLELQMPAEPGNYELRYKLGDAVVLAVEPIEVVDAIVSLDAPDEVHAGTDVLVHWVGPDASLDTIVLRLVGDNGYESYAYVSGGNPVSLRVPEEPGSYEFAYRLNDSDVIATRPITVVPPGTELSAPEATGPVAITLEADMGEMGFSIVWSAIPVPGQDLPPEAFAMQDGTTEPLSADFLPGDYDVLGDAGDQVFAGRISVVAGADNRFVIPYSAALSPAGEDEIGSGVTAVRISGETYDGMFKRWTATPLETVASAVLIDSGEYRPQWWETTLEQGRWLIEGTAEGAERPLFSGEIVVPEQGPAEFVIPLAGANAAAAEPAGNRAGPVGSDFLSAVGGVAIAAPPGVDLAELLTRQPLEN